MERTYTGRFSDNPGIKRELLPLVQDALRHRYTVEREIARGGAARVFLARDMQNTPVALKVLRPELSVTVTAERFLREIDLLSGFDHPHIAKLVDSGESNFIVFYVMPYMEGPTLREHLSRVRRASVNDTLFIAYQLLDALDYAHRRDIVHRDVKPENIVLTSRGAVLVDFGIARAIAASGKDKITRSGFAVGTSAYMSPEQVRGESKIDHRSDVYSLGCVLFECLTGRPPFVGRSDEIVRLRHIEEQAPRIRDVRADIPGPLGEIIDKALRNDHRTRWSSAADMRASVAALGSASP
jgi:serine/threonine-protein kinase